MTPSPDLIHELRASRPSAPADLRNRVRAIVSEQPRQAPWSNWRFPVRRGMLVVVPAAAALALASAGVLGLARSDSPQALRQAQAPVDDSATAESTAPNALGATRAGANGAGKAADTAGPRAQRVSASLTVEVANPDAVSRAAQDALDLTRSLGGYVVSSSVATGEQGSASLTVRVPVDRVQDAIAGLSGLGRIVSQQVTIDDLQQNLDELTHRQASVLGQIARIRARLDSETLDAQTEAVLRARPRHPARGTARAEAGHLLDRGRGAHVHDPARRGHARRVWSRRAAVTHRPHDRRGARRSRLGGVIALGMLIVLAPFALVGIAAWLGRRTYRRREEARLLAT